jgi:hypothetical protein
MHLFHVLNLPQMKHFEGQRYKDSDLFKGKQRSKAKNKYDMLELHYLLAKLPLSAISWS